MQKHQFEKGALYSIFDQSTNEQVDAVYIEPFDDNNDLHVLSIQGRKVIHVGDHITSATLPSNVNKSEDLTWGEALIEVFTPVFNLTLAAIFTVLILMTAGFVFVKVREGDKVSTAQAQDFMQVIANEQRDEHIDRYNRTLNQNRYDRAAHEALMVSEYYFAAGDDFKTNEWLKRAEEAQNRHNRTFLNNRRWR